MLLTEENINLIIAIVGATAGVISVIQFFKKEHNKKWLWLIIIFFVLTAFFTLKYYNIRFEPKDSKKIEEKPVKKTLKITLAKDTFDNGIARYAILKPKNWELKYPQSVNGDCNRYFDTNYPKNNILLCGLFAYAACEFDEMHESNFECAVSQILEGLDKDEELLYSSRIKINGKLAGKIKYLTGEPKERLVNYVILIDGKDMAVYLTLNQETENANPEVAEKIFNSINFLQ